MAFLLAASFLLQLAAVVFALRLTRVSGKPAAWVLLALAILLMAVRRAFPFARYLAGDPEIAPDVWGELVALVISGMMVGGLAMLAPLLRRVRGVEEMVPQLLESAPDAMVIADAQDHIALVNAQAVRLFGWPRHQLIGQDVTMLIPERFRERHRAKRARYHEHPRTRVLGADTDVFALRKDGSEFPVEISVSPLQRGGVQFVVSAIRDISERRQAEGALKESEGRYRTLLDDVLDNSTVGVCIVDARGAVAWVNRAFEGFFGLARRDLLGAPVRDIVKDRLAPLLADPAPFRDAVLASYGTKEKELLECHVTAGEDRVERWLEYRSQPIESGLYKGGRIEHYSDVTERCMAEDRIRLFANIARSMQIGLLVYRLEDITDDHSLRLITINPEAERLLGVGKAELLGTLIDDAFPALRERGLPQLFAEVIRTQETRAMQDFAYRDQRILENVWSFKAFPLPEASVGIVFERITEQKRTEQLIEHIAAGVAGETGDVFFRSLVTQLAMCLDLDYAFVGEMEPDGKGVRTVAVYENGKIGENFRYDLEGTPCAFVVGQRPCVHTEGVAARFPEDHLLKEMGVECYVGSPLFDSEGTPLGLIAVLGRRPLANPAIASSVLQIFAARAAAELERKRASTRN